MSIEETAEYIAASKKNGKESADNLIAEVMESDRYKRYQNPQTRLSILKSALSRSIAVASATEDAEPFEGSVFIFGGTDSYGTKRPVDYFALRKNGAFVKVSCFRDHIPAPCKCTVKGQFSAKWGSVTPSEGGITNIEPKTIEDCQRVLVKRALTVKDMQELDNLVAYGIYAFRGEIQWVNATKVFTAEGSVAGENALICEDEHKPPRKHVTLAMVLNAQESGYSITLNLARQRVGAPVVAIEDFVPMVQDAMEISQDSKEQQSELKNLLYGREVVGIGTVGKIKEGSSNDILYINCTCGFLAEVLPDLPDPAVENLVDAKEVEPACIEMNKKEREEKAKTKTSTAPKVEEPTHETSPAEEEVDSGSSPNEMDVYVNALVEFGKTTNNDPKWLPSAKARNTANIPEEIDDAIVKLITKKAGEKFAALKGDA